MDRFLRAAVRHRYSEASARFYTGSMCTDERYRTALQDQKLIQWSPTDVVMRGEFGTSI